MNALFMAGAFNEDRVTPGALGDKYFDQVVFG
jgi:hypothetical protein